MVAWQSRSRTPPTLRNVFSCRMRRSLACKSSGISLISSRKIVPVPAISSRPVLSRSAPVKEPFTWPKSSLSSRLAVRAAQLTATNGCPGCRRRCTARAATSLPVPVSPATSTGLHWLAATSRIIRRASLERRAAAGQADGGGRLIQEVRRRVERHAGRPGDAGGNSADELAQTRQAGGARDAIRHARLAVFVFAEGVGPGKDDHGRTDRQRGGRELLEVRPELRRRTRPVKHD